MNHQLASGLSILAAVLQRGRGLFATRQGAAPAQPLMLYDMEGCPWCRMVREVLTELDLDVLCHSCPKGGQRYRQRVADMGGKQQFPYLVDPNTDTALYESADIITYLYQHYGNGKPAPGQLLRWLHIASAICASLPRADRGLHVAGSRGAEQPLALYSFESSPYTRLVRERLSELEIPFLIHQCGRTQWQDWLTAPMRARLRLDYRPTQRNRQALLQRTGHVAMPYLIDANTGTELFESRNILEYINATYARQSD